MAPCEASKLRLSSSACTSSSHKVTKNINHAPRRSVFSRIHDRLCDSVNNTADVETKAVTYAAAADHFTGTWVHVHTRAAQHTVMPSQCFDTGPIVSFSERCPARPLPLTKTDVAGGRESINQSRRLPIVMFHLQLMCIECLREFPIMHG